MVVTKSELANHILEDYRQAKHTTILKAYKGKAAVDGIKKLFFGGDLKKGAAWAKGWSSYEKSQAILLITESRLPKRKFKPVLGYEFLIGDIKTGSSLGSSWPTVREGLLALKEL